MFTCIPVAGDEISASIIAAINPNNLFILMKIPLHHLSRLQALTKNLLEAKEKAVATLHHLFFAMH